jgi:hypothetical protein
MLDVLQRILAKYPKLSLASKANQAIDNAPLQSLNLNKLGWVGVSLAICRH